MSEDHAVGVPPSFHALYVAPGRIKPNAPRAEIAERHEFCEDLATLLAEPARRLRLELGGGEDLVLERMLRGLGGDDAVVSPAEARWVVTRLAEMLGWGGRP